MALPSHRVGRVTPVAHYARRSKAVLREEGLAGLTRRACLTLQLFASERAIAAHRTLGDSARLLVLTVVLRPATAVLPRSIALAIADLVGLLKALTPMYGLRTTAAVRRGYSLGPARSLATAAALLAQPLRDFVVTRRLVQGRETARDWSFTEANPEVVDALRRTGSSFILATGHFVRRAQAPLYLASVVPQQMTVLANPLPTRSRGAAARWLSRHFGNMLDYVQTARPDTVLLQPGSRDAVRDLAATLRRPGNVVYIAVDAPWHDAQRGTIVRPFAARASRRFATGAARLARLTGTPIALCIPRVDSGERVVIEWIRVVPPPDPRDAQADARITHLLLDDIERAVGQHPTQYVIEHLGPRKWNRRIERWE